MEGFVSTPSPPEAAELAACSELHLKQQNQFQQEKKCLESGTSAGVFVVLEAQTVKQKPQKPCGNKKKAALLLKELFSCFHPCIDELQQELKPRQLSDLQTSCLF